MTAYTLPLPPSSNALVMPVVFRGDRAKPMVRLIATKAAREFRAAAHRILPVLPVGGVLELFATFYVASIASDASNRIKALEDAMKGRLFFDDNQIAEIHVVKVVTTDPAEVGVIVEVRAGDPIEHSELSKRLAKSVVGQRAAEAAQHYLELEEQKGATVLDPSTYRATTRALEHVPESLRAKLERLAKPASYPAKKADDEQPPPGWGGAA